MEKAEEYIEKKTMSLITGKMVTPEEAKTACKIAVLERDIEKLKHSIEACKAFPDPSRIEKLQGEIESKESEVKKLMQDGSN